MRLPSLMTGLLALLCVLAQVVVARGGRGHGASKGVLQHDPSPMLGVEDLMDVAAVGSLPAGPSLLAPSIVHDDEILLPSHLVDAVNGAPAAPASESHSSLGASKPQLFTPLPMPYTRADPACTAYARQDNCVGYPTLRTDALPPCGSFAGPLPRNASAFAIIGDYGLDGNCASLVAALLMRLQKQFGELQFVMTTGDNAYWSGSCASFQSGVSQYYSSFLPNPSPTCTDPVRTAPREYNHPHWEDMQRFQANKAALRADERRTKLARLARAVAAGVQEEQLQRRPRGSSGASLRAPTPPRFFPSLGNHDWDTYSASGNLAAMPYFQFFSYLPEFEPAALAAGQFYRADTLIPGVELFALNSNLGKPSGSAANLAMFGKMVSWLEVSLRNSSAPFKLVYFHHPPVGTAQHDALSPWMDLDFEAWGASAVFVGHEHVYERLVSNRAKPDGSAPTMPFIVNGLGGHPWTYQIDGCPAYPGSQFRYNAFHGLQLAVHSWDEQAQKEKIDFCFYSYEQGGSMVDQFTVMANGTKH